MRCFPARPSIPPRDEHRARNTGQRRRPFPPAPSRGNQARQPQPCLGNKMVVYPKTFLMEGNFLVDRATALQWRYLPRSTGPLHCGGAIYHGRQVHCIAVALSTMVDRSIALQWRYLPWSTGPLHCNGAIYQKCNLRHFSGGRCEQWRRRAGQCTLPSGHEAMSPTEQPLRT